MFAPVLVENVDDLFELRVERRLASFDLDPLPSPPLVETFGDEPANLLRRHALGWAPGRRRRIGCSLRTPGRRRR